MTPIISKWHRLSRLIEEDEVFLTAAPDSPLYDKKPTCDHWSDHPPGDKTKLMKLIQDSENLPKFVVEPDLLTLATKDEYVSSLMDMKKANVFRLPFSQMVVEIPARAGHHIVILGDIAAIDLGKPGIPDELSFYGINLTIDKDKNGEYLVVSPSIIFLGLKQDDQGVINIGIMSQALSFFHPTKAINDLVYKTATKDASPIYHAIFAALLLMRTEGVEKEVVDTERLNRQRKKSNKPPIARHTYIHIGKVYRRVGNQEVAENYVPRRSPRPHWRRGHIKTVRYGAGKTLFRQVYINPRLVAFKDTDLDTDIKKPEYKVAL